LADPVKQHPSVFGGMTLLEDFPYLLPCLVSALLTAMGFLVGIFWLEESLHTPKIRIVVDESSSSDTRGDGKCDSSSLYRFPEFRGSVASLSSGRNNSTTNAKSIRYHSYGSQRSQEEDEEATCQESLLPKRKSSSSSSPSSSPFDIPNASKHTIIAYAVLALSSILYDELFPLWTATNLPVGLSFSSRDIGMAMTATGIVDLFSQLLIYPWIQEFFGLIAVFRWSMAGYVVIHLLFPLVSIVAEKNGGDIYNPWVWISLITFMGIRVTAAVFGFTSIIIMVR
jgi:hypothetical protein